MTRKVLLTVFVIALSVQCGSSRAITVELNAAKDNTLYEDPFGTLSNGAGPGFFAGTNAGGEARRGLIEFDIAGGVPAGATITSVTLTLYMSRESSEIPEDIELRRVDAEWGEAGSVANGGQGGGGAGGTALNGDATWTHRIKPGSAWNSAGGDFSSTVSAVETVSGFDFYTWGSTAQMVSDVQDWLISPTTNHGWILIGNESFTQTAKRFDSSENSEEDNRPVLLIDYSLGGSPADFTDDGDVDGEDLGVWNDSYNADDGGDTDEDGDTDGRDFLTWQQEYTGQLPGIAMVPEPAGVSSLLVVAMLAALRARYRL